MDNITRDDNLVDCVLLYYDLLYGLYFHIDTVLVKIHKFGRDVFFS